MNKFEKVIQVSAFIIFLILFVLSLVFKPFIQELPQKQWSILSTLYILLLLIFVIINSLLINRRKTKVARDWMLLAIIIIIFIFQVNYLLNIL